MASIPLSQLTIKQATPPQVELSRRLTWAGWNRGRSVEEYLRQDAEMDKYSFCTDNRYFTWYGSTLCGLYYKPLLISLTD